MGIRGQEIDAGRRHSVYIKEADNRETQVVNLLSI